MSHPGGDGHSSSSPGGEPTSREDFIAQILASLGEQWPPVTSQTGTRVVRSSTSQIHPGHNRTITFIGNRNRISNAGHDNNNPNDNTTTTTNTPNDVNITNHSATDTPAPKPDNVSSNPDTVSIAGSSMTGTTTAMPADNNEHAAFVCTSQRPRYEYVPAPHDAYSLGAPAAPNSAFAISYAKEETLRLVPTQNCGASQLAQPTSQFDTLHPVVVENLLASGYNTLHLIQLEAVRRLHSSGPASVHIAAPIGAGKTLAYLLPVINNLIRRTHRDNNPVHKGGLHSVVNGCVYPAAIVLVPTAEMAAAVIHTANMLVHRSVFKTAAVYPGVSRSDQQSVLLGGADIIIGTLSRLQHYVDSGIVSLQSVQYIVLDDADKLATASAPSLQTFFGLESLNGSGKAYRIVSVCSSPDQQLVLELARSIPAYGTVLTNTLGRGHLHQLFQGNKLLVKVPMDGDKKARLLEALTRDGSPIKVEESMIIFTNTKKASEVVAKYLIDHGLAGSDQILAYNSDRTQRQREEMLERFREDKIKILVATLDIGRGLNFKNLRQIVHFDIPADLLDYDYSSGRVGRMGYPGTVVTFVQGDEEHQKVKDHLRNSHAATIV